MMRGRIPGRERLETRKLTLPELRRLALAHRAYGLIHADREMARGDRREARYYRGFSSRMLELARRAE